MTITVDGRASGESRRAAFAGTVEPSARMPAKDRNMNLSFTVLVSCVGGWRVWVQDWPGLPPEQLAARYRLSQLRRLQRTEPAEAWSLLQEMMSGQALRH